MKRGFFTLLGVIAIPFAIILSCYSGAERGAFLEKLKLAEGYVLPSEEHKKKLVLAEASAHLENAEVSIAAGVILGATGLLLLISAGEEKKKGNTL